MMATDSMSHAFQSRMLSCRYARGLTPNPDLACNRAIKFDALLRHARSLGADAVCTGHYARLRVSPEGENCCINVLDVLFI